MFFKMRILYIVLCANDLSPSCSDKRKNIVSIFGTLDVVFPTDCFHGTILGQVLGNNRNLQEISVLLWDTSLTVKVSQTDMRYSNRYEIFKAGVRLFVRVPSCCALSSLFYSRRKIIINTYSLSSSSLSNFHIFFTVNSNIEQFRAVWGMKGRSFFLPGNHIRRKKILKILRGLKIF